MPLHNAPTVRSDKATLLENRSSQSTAGSRERLQFLIVSREARIPFMLVTRAIPLTTAYD